MHVILPPFIFVIIATLTLASFGKSLGIRKIYVKVLLFIFEVKIFSNKTKYFRLRLSDEVGTERPETDLRLT